MGRTAHAGDRDFIDALRAVMHPTPDVAGLAAHLGCSAPLVYSWLRGEYVPDDITVFRVEAFFDLEPGVLSHHLGFVPVDAVRKLAASFGQVLTLVSEVADMPPGKLAQILRASLAPDARCHAPCPRTHRCARESG